MPHIIVKLYPGRSEGVKTALAEAISAAVVAHAKVGEHTVSVAIEEVAPGDWADVYATEIEPQLDRLYKKPAYTPT